MVGLQLKLALISLNHSKIQITCCGILLLHHKHDMSITGQTSFKGCLAIQFGKGNAPVWQ